MYKTEYLKIKNLKVVRP